MTIPHVVLALALALTQFRDVAYTVGWETMGAEETDAYSVTATIVRRARCRRLTFSQVVREPGQFQVAPLLDRPPPNLRLVLPRVVEALQEPPLDLPQVDHFWSPLLLDQPPYWALEEHEVVVPGSAHRFYKLDWCATD